MATPLSFLGSGILKPFRRDAKSDFANASGVENFRACVSQILGTRANGPRSRGELRWRPGFGSRLYLLRHAPLNETTNALARIYAQSAIARWEPRLLVSQVEVHRPDERTLFARVYVVPRSENSAANQVVEPIAVDVPVK